MRLYDGTAIHNNHLVVRRRYSKQTILKDIKELSFIIVKSRNVSLKWDITEPKHFNRTSQENVQVISNICPVQIPKLCIYQHYSPLLATGDATTSIFVAFFFMVQMCYFTHSNDSHKDLYHPLSFSQSWVFQLAHFNMVKKCFCLYNSEPFSVSISQML